MKRTGPLHLTIAEQIKDNLKMYAGASLPSVTNLSQSFRTSRSTISAALAHLEREGLVKTHIGRCADIVGRAPKSIERSPKLSASHRTYDYFVTRIADGTLAMGKPLPKASTIARDLNASSRTISRVLARLVSEKLVHLRGKGYVVGSNLNSPTRANMVSPPILIVLTRRSSHWEGLQSSSRNRPFVFSFIAQALQQNVRLINVVLNGTDQIRYGIKIPSGVKGLRDVVRRAEGRYIGAIVAAGEDSSSLLSMAWKQLLAFNKPIVWFNRNDERGALVPKSPLFTQCLHSELQMAETAVRFLHDRGHRHAIYPHDSAIGWQRDRGSYLVEHGLSMSPKLSIELEATEDPAPWDDPLRSGLVERLSKLADLLTSVKRAEKQFKTLWTTEHKISNNISAPRFMELIEYTKAVRFGLAPKAGELYQRASHIWTALEISSALLPGGASAVIAPRDRNAIPYHRWAIEAGHKIPELYSLISFDNEFDSTYSPIASVDLGFSDLGYQAFHAIMGDIPTTRDRQGTITARPRVVDNGSVGLIR